jgi:ABC-type glycerol-3-phosphate transport system substrate-binding protein
MYVHVFGNEPTDLQEVLDLINERLVSLINTKIELSFISLADWPTKYPLLLTGGDSIDLVYASGWNGYPENAKKGAFVELTPEFIETYMPMSAKMEKEAAWNQAKVGNQIFAAPRNYTENQSYGAVLIRKDIREKYNIPEVTDFESYENFLFEVAANDKEGYGMYAFPSLPMVGEFMQPEKNIYTVYNNLVWNADDEPDADNLQFLYTTEEYHWYITKMAEWAAKGVWPTSAISSTTHTYDQFSEGRSYSMPARLQEAAEYMNDAEALGGECEFIDIIPEGHYTRLSNYNGDMMAISNFSQDPERAAVLLDILKCDKEINDLCQGGIEGRHYIANEDGTRSNGPEYQDYPYSGWAWGLREGEYYREEAVDERIAAVEASFTEKLMPDEMWIFDGFSTDDSMYTAEIAVINSIISEYRYSFDLGVYGDKTEATYQEFVKKLNDAGLEKVMDEWIRQAKEFTGT